MDEREASRGMDTAPAADVPLGTVPAVGLLLLAALNLGTIGHLA